MQFTTLFAGAQALSLFSLVPVAVQNAFGGLIEETSKPGSKFPVPGNSPAQICEAGRPQMLNITELTLDPALPIAGAPLKIEATGTLLSNVTVGSYVDVVFKSGFTDVSKTRYDLCTYLPEVGYECPVGPAEISITKSVDVPATLTAGEYLVIAKAYDAAGDLLTCLFADFTLV